MSDWREFFRKHCNFLFYNRSLSTKPFGVEELYQNFNARRESEAKEKLTKVSGPVGCRCPIEPDQDCAYFGKNKVCNHPSSKPPEPECEHKNYRFLEPYFKDHGDKHCRDCGDKL